MIPNVGFIFASLNIFTLPERQRESDRSSTRKQHTIRTFPIQMGDSANAINVSQSNLRLAKIPASLLFQTPFFFYRERALRLKVDGPFEDGWNFRIRLPRRPEVLLLLKFAINILRGALVEGFQAILLLKEVGLGIAAEGLQIIVVSLMLLEVEE